MQGWPSPRSGEDPAVPTLGQVAPAKTQGGWVGGTGLGWGGDYLWEQKVELGRLGFGPRGPNILWPCSPQLQRSPRPARHSQRKRCAAGASGEVRASGFPLQRFAARSPPPPSIRRTGAGTRWHLPGSATRAAEDHNPVRTTPWGHWRGGTEPTERRRREAPPPTRQRVPGQCAPRALQAALGETLVCRVACREEGTKGGLYAPRLVRLGPRSPHL